MLSEQTLSYARQALRDTRRLFGEASNWMTRDDSSSAFCLSGSLNMAQWVVVAYPAQFWLNCRRPLGSACIRPQAQGAF